MKTSPSSLKPHHHKLIKRLLYVALAVTGVAQLPALAAKVPRRWPSNSGITAFA